MIESGRRLRFPLKTRESLGIPSDLIRQKLESHETMQAGVFCLVDHAHASAAEFFENAVVGDGLAEHWRASYVAALRKSITQHLGTVSSFIFC
jgi:hypothetical protein